jgi:hypothetical protein
LSHEITDEEVENIKLLDPLSRELAGACFDSETSRQYGLASWIMATLTAVNGGAIVATVGFESFPTIGLKWAVGTWIAAIAMAFFSGFAAKNQARNQAAVYFSMKLFPQRNFPKGWKFNEEKFQEQARRSERASNKLNLVSLLLFLIGCLIAGVTF